MFHYKIDEQEFSSQKLNIVLESDTIKINFYVNKENFNNALANFNSIKITNTDGEVLFESQNNTFEIIEKYYSFQEKDQEEIYLLTYGAI